MDKLTRGLPLLLALLAGCAATPVAPLAVDADAKRFESAPNAAIIYLYRPPAPGNAGVSTVWVDDRLVGESLPTTYFRVAVRPGRNRIAAAGGDVGRIEIDTQAEGVYFVRMQVLGTAESESSTIFMQVAPEVAKASIVNCCRLLETWRPGQQRLQMFGM